MAELRGKLHHGATPIVDEQTGEAVAQVIWAARLHAARLRRRLKDALAPVAVVVLAPVLSIGSREHEI